MSTPHMSLSCLHPPFLLLPALAGCNPKQQPGGSGPSSRSMSNNNRKWRNNGRIRAQPGEDEAERRRVEDPSKFKLWQEGPNFDTDLPQDVLALRGRSAFLTCRVFDRQNRTVSTELVK